ncbi:YkvA family protein [Desulfogranum marinum]|uniref:YkvA family protein n=1 Tax=Desulfogranum marinum TaxID=453220 RepID=UPI00196436E0|nr:DUF1232 domain-containing protein [Desulfogranum marinum]MBM9511444.1 DUF1232 domain-containing protein [Desulfogranum marinum]
MINRVVEMIRNTGAVFFSKETPLYVKIILGSGLLYVISPYDLIPEWVPVVGILDDVALAALLITWAQRFNTPED